MSQAWSFNCSLEKLEEFRPLAQKLLDDTWENITTRDRNYGEVNKFEVVEVSRNENLNLWLQYWLRRETLHELCTKQEPVGKKASTSYQDELKFVQTGNVVDWTPQAPGGLRDEAGEVFLLHGTSSPAARQICTNGFSLGRIGSRSGGCIYGPGIYFTENSSKADEYSKPDGQLRTMLLCRVAMGQVLCVVEAEPDLHWLCGQINEKKYHSVLGDRARARGTYREFVIYDSSQVFPEYLITYKVKAGG
eukprot:gnl/MRDRNA2_/MRDRNA2_181321_c0_seq1.p1 gnl/MRDRNA2_/MRDRNA2_181321_c0~~gnl/MRDRNA2_/MRDRNA2_181321_c0_seq1.p1  ORF type:complete len:269 (-),score=37.95 gnl/MRDRNA2_/MRDRNA2_181321_c0_seq1:5-748(-)